MTMQSPIACPPMFGRGHAKAKNVLIFLFLAKSKANTLLRVFRPGYED